MNVALNAQQTTLCMGDMATITVSYETASGSHILEMPRVPPNGLSAMRYNDRLDAFTKALQARHRRSGRFYESADERIAHAKWLAACADAMEREARMHRTLASRLSGAHAT